MASSPQKRSHSLPRPPARAPRVRPPLLIFAALVTLNLLGWGLFLAFRLAHIEPRWVFGPPMPTLILYSPPQPTPSPLPPAANPTPTPLLGPAEAAALPPGQVDYQPLINQIDALLAQADYDVGVAFEDIETGQAFSLGRQGRFHAMSTFKGPLAAYYLWLGEHGLISEQPGDEFTIEDMLSWSSNTDTTCLFKRVGGIAGFNDWLADQGFSRENSFVYTWHNWYCLEHGERYAPVSDRRYLYGDPTLGLPGDGALLQCPDSRVPCDKAFSPIELVGFYARLYRGEVLTPDDTARWLGWMEKSLPITSLFDSLPPEAQGNVHAYVKNGYHAADAAYPMNFYHEAGILDTPYGAFALAVFMQDNPNWRGTDIHGQIGLLAYLHFTAAHRR